MRIKPVALLLGLLITGCSNPYISPPPNEGVQGMALGVVGGAAAGAVVGGASASVGAPVGALIGGIAGGIIGHYLATHSSAVQRLTNNGVQVIHIGDNLTFVLPSDLFFQHGTPVLNSNYYRTLNHIADMIKSFDKYSVLVAGYTDDSAPPIRGVALSRQQALVVGDYLWTKGIDTRVLSETGYGEASPIANNNTPAGRAMNRRVEITLRVFHEPDGDV